LDGIKKRNRLRPDVVVPLPASAVELIVAFLTAMADRKPVPIFHHEAEFTTKRAADFLNVSRRYAASLRCLSRKLTFVTALWCSERLFKD
jgi:hypothetical protein